MDLRKYDLYILDYDGCLIDSMPMWKYSASSYIKYLGYNPKEDLDERIPIFKDIYCAKVVKEEYNIPMSVEEIKESIDNYVDMVYPKIPLKKGALKILEALKKLNKKIVVLSASGIDIISLSMEALHISDYFLDVISVYKHNSLSKSDGTAMEYVRNKYNLSKENILMIDDSLSNVLGAKEYGVDCIAIEDEVNFKNKEELIKNSMAYMSMDELSKLL